jgi:hypothetical protein
MTYMIVGDELTRHDNTTTQCIHSSIVCTLHLAPHTDHTHLRRLGCRRARRHCRVAERAALEGGDAV